MEAIDRRSLAVAPATPAPRWDGLPRRYRLQVPQPIATRLDHDRDFGHRVVMALLPKALMPDNLLVESGGRLGPRAYTGTLWTVDTHTPQLIVQTRAPVAASADGELLPPLPLGRAWRMRVTLEAVHDKQPEIDPAVNAALLSLGVRWNSPRTRVDDADLTPWVEAHFLRRGWRDIRIQSITRRTVRRRQAQLHLADVTLSATVDDLVLAATSLAEGIGHGKSYGAGMILPAASIQAPRKGFTK